MPQLRNIPSDLEPVEFQVLVNLVAQGFTITSPDGSAFTPYVEWSARWITKDFDRWMRQQQRQDAQPKRGK